MRLYRVFSAILAAVMLNVAAVQTPAVSAFIYRETPFVRNAPNGIMGADGRAIIPAQYEIAQAFSNGYFSLGNKGSTPDIDYAWKDQTVALFGPQGNRLSNFDYYEIYMLADDVFVGYTKGDAHFISQYGELLYKAGFPAYVSVTSAGYAIHEDDYTLPQKRLKLISKDFETLYEGMHGSSHVAYENAIIYEENKFHGILSAKGEDIVQPTKYRTIYSIDGGYLLFNEGDATYGVLNSNGQVVIPAIYSSINSFRNGIFTASIGNKIFILDEKGNELYSDTNCWVEHISNGQEDSPLLFRKKSGDSWYLRWPDGRILQGDTMFDFSHMRGNKVVMAMISNINTNGSGIIRILDTETGEKTDIQGRHIGVINDNVMDASYIDADYNWRTKLFDMQGRPLADGAVFTYAINADYEEGGVIIAGRPSKLPHTSLYGLLNEDGSWLLPCRYNQLTYVAPGVYSARSGSRIGYINEAGEWIYSATAYSLLDD